MTATSPDREPSTPTTAASRVLVIILALNEWEDTIECLHSLQGAAPNFRVVVCDNGSTPPVYPHLADTCRALGVDLLRNERNLGFAGGNAWALAQYSLDDFDYVLLLNNDTVTSVEDLRELVAVARSHDAQVAGPLITYFDEPTVVWQAAGRVLPGVLHGRVPSMNRPAADLGRAPVEAAFLTGCAMLISVPHIKAAGFLDTRYFYSVEDLDYCIAARRRGARVLFVPTARVLHKVSRTSGGWHSTFATRHFLWGRGFVTRKYARGLRWCLAASFLLFVLVPVRYRQTRRSPNGRDARLKALFEAAIAGLRGAPLR